MVHKLYLPALKLFKSAVSNTICQQINLNSYSFSYRGFLLLNLEDHVKKYLIFYHISCLKSLISLFNLYTSSICIYHKYT